MSKTITVTSHVPRDFLQNSAYFSTVPKVVWEYVSNSVDNPKPGQPVHVEVMISKNRIVVSDDGCGMSREELQNFFQMHAQNVRRRRGERVRGRYGTGKCAAFGIADALQVQTSKQSTLNVVELSREDIDRAPSGKSFSVPDIVVDQPTTEEDGTRIIISQIHARNIELAATIAYVERHMGRQLHHHTVVINDHVCEYEEPHFSWEQVFRPPQNVANIIGDLELTVKVSPSPLDNERAGVDILSKGIWHDTTVGTLEGDVSRRIFGEVDMPLLEERYDTEKTAPFDNTRNMTLNKSNPLVVSLLGWIDECLHVVARDVARQEKERKASEESKRLDAQAQQLSKVLNDDFRDLQMQLEKIRRTARIQEQGTLEELVPRGGQTPTQYQMGGPEAGDGSRGDQAGPGEERRPGSSLLPGDEKGGLGGVSERKQKQSTFRVEYLHEGERSRRSHYERDTRTIAINLDHPQIARAARAGGIDGREFKEMTYEIAFVEYAIALSTEKLARDAYYASSDALYDIRETINRISRTS